MRDIIDRCRLEKERALSTAEMHEAEKMAIGDLPPTQHSNAAAIALLESWLETPDPTVEADWSKLRVELDDATMRCAG